MHFVSTLLTAIALLATLSYVYYRKWFNMPTLILGIGWGLATCTIGVASYFRLLPVIYLIVALGVYGVMFNTVTWLRNRDTHSLRILLASITVFLAAIYALFFNKHNLSLPMREWSFGSYVVTALLIGSAMALFVP
jgi:hypothetical protein